MSVAFAGYYGMDNFGDDLFALACLQEASRWAKLGKPVLVSKPIEGVQASYSCPRQLASIYNRHGKVGGSLRLALHSLQRIRSELFVYGGGSLFKQVSRNRKFGAWISQLRGGKQAAIGVSLGPFPSIKAEREVAHHLSHFDYLSLRDQTSYEWAVAQAFDCPIEMCGDLAGVLPFKRAVADGPTIIGVSLAQFDQFRLGDGSPASCFYAALIEGVASRAAAWGATVRILDLNGHGSVGDQHLSQGLAEALLVKKIPTELFTRRTMSSAKLATAIGHCGVVISARLHGAIAAYLSDVPFALVEYEEKCSQFLDDIGYPSGSRIHSLQTSPYEVEELLERLLRDFEQPRMERKAYQLRSAGHFGLAPWAKEALKACRQ